MFSIVRVKRGEGLRHYVVDCDALRGSERAAIGMTRTLAAEVKRAVGRGVEKRILHFVQDDKDR